MHYSLIKEITMKVVVNWSLEAKVYELAPNDSLMAPNSYLMLLCQPAMKFKTIQYFVL